MLASESVRVLLTILLSFLTLKIMYTTAETIQVAPAEVPSLSEESSEEEQSLHSLKVLNERQKTCIDVYPCQLLKATAIEDDIKNCIDEANEKWHDMLKHLLLALDKLNGYYHKKISNALGKHQQRPSMQVTPAIHSESFGGDGEYIYKQMEKVNSIIKFWTESVNKCILKRLDETVTLIEETKPWMKECIASISSVESLLKPGISSDLNLIDSTNAPLIANETHQGGRKTLTPQPFYGFNDTASVIGNILSRGSNGLDKSLGFMENLFNPTARDCDYSTSSNSNKHEISQDSPTTDVNEDPSATFNDTYQGKFKTYYLPPQTPRPFYGFNDTASVISNVAFHDSDNLDESLSFIGGIFNRATHDSNNSPISDSRKSKDVRDVAKTDIKRNSKGKIKALKSKPRYAFEDTVPGFHSKLGLNSHQMKLFSKNRKRTVRQALRPTKRWPTSHHIIHY